MKRRFQEICAATVTFTRIPIPWTLTEESFSFASWHLPLIGWLIVALMYPVIRYLGSYPDFLYIPLLVLPVLLSGGMHEDGLADCADGIFGGKALERRLQIMKDPHLGTYGTIALFVSFQATLKALEHIPIGELPRALAIVYPLSRLAAPLLFGTLPYVRKTDSKAQEYLGGSRLNILWSLLWTLPVFYFQPDKYLLLTFAMSVLFCRWFFKRNLGGITGDCLGATVKVVELSCLIVLAFQSYSPLAKG